MSVAPNVSSVHSKGCGCGCEPSSLAVLRLFVLGSSIWTTTVDWMTVACQSVSEYITARPKAFYAKMPMMHLPVGALFSLDDLRIAGLVSVTDGDLRGMSMHWTTQSG
jgi:hypothetical protein